MRIWSLPPEYLDTKGLVALWRETLLAQKVLEGSTSGYRNHPQLNRFKEKDKPLELIGSYLYQIWIEANKRGYNFDQTKIKKILPKGSKRKIKVTSGQLEYELKHLLKKLKTRDNKRYKELKKIKQIEAHQLFKIVPGDIEDWEVF